MASFSLLLTGDTHVLLFSRVLRDSTPRFVGPSVRRSVRRSHFTFFAFL